MQGHCTGKCDCRQTKNSPVTNCLTFFSIWRSRHFNLRWPSFIIRISSVYEIFATAIYLKYYRFNRAVQFLYDQYKQPICCCLDVGLWSQLFHNEPSRSAITPSAQLTQVLPQTANFWSLSTVDLMDNREHADCWLLHRDWKLVVYIKKKKIK